MIELADGIIHNLRQLISGRRGKAPEREIDPIEEAKLLGEKFNSVWGGGPNETPFEQLSTVLRYSRAELVTEASSVSSHLVVFLASLTQKDKVLVSSSVWPIQRVMKDEGIIQPTLGDFREQVQRLDLRFRRGESASASTVNFGPRRIAFLVAGFQE